MLHIALRFTLLILDNLVHPLARKMAEFVGFSHSLWSEPGRGTGRGQLLGRRWRKVLDVHLAQAFKELGVI
jgi:hypothetical protein